VAKLTDEIKELSDEKITMGTRYEAVSPLDEEAEVAGFADLKGYCQVNTPRP
jgi:hypothetical protein